MSTTNDYRNTRPLRPEGGKTAKTKRAGLLANIGKTIHNILMLVFRLAKWISGPGKGILMGLLGMYFLLVGAENYWQSWNPNVVSFMPKPFIHDKANLLMLFENPFRGGFWFSVLFAAAVNALQSAWVRENRSINKLMEKYRNASGVQTPEKKEGAIWLAKWTRNRIRNYGRRSVRVAGIAVFISYLIDLGNAFCGFPIVGVSPAEIIVNFVWVILSVFGTELAWSFI